ncbi:Iron transport multicopper oxidase fio1 [Zancudomyces culisetae]|uniref:Iron transport multicopper oxidase fio1 n=1 Tax=Zancudomyces culisetae TaxID=1213189 RepID=A0A1R1PDM3_ZANCU|nr:Iron transport multicopper oxidase fio1 [Zancudomyces culisetae]OMH80825.1 Iron transport multicopper oxidase fio1 [Zancudomyces culisetae]|eukprot:OMH79003.1 Iron transport multicopper oxidase fio1 [Zancudomyces culisetae]
MKMIEVDGTEIQMVTAESIEISPGQRVSFLITTKNDTNHNYLIHADMDPDYFDSVPDYLHLNLTATLKYSELSNSKDPEPHKWNSIPDTDLKPLDKKQYKAPDKIITIVSDIQEADDGTTRGLINGVTFVPPKVPTLLSMLSMGELATNPEVYGPKTNAFVVEYNKEIQVIIQNAHMDPHPFHLHGHKFEILDVGEGEYKTKNKISTNTTYDNLIRRDTVNVPGQGYAVIQFTSDNPGAWLFHCHNVWHMLFGMRAVIVEAPLEAQRTIRNITESENSLCLAAGFKTTGNGGGGIGLDLSGAPNSPNLINFGIHSKGVVALVFCVLSALSGTYSVISYIRALVKLQPEGA